MPESLESAARKLAAVGRAMSDDDRIAQAYAELALESARRLAAGRPTPQARMAASGIEARQGALYGAAGRIVFGRGGPVPLGEIGWGAEMGSSLYPQFGPRHAQGAFLRPAGEDDDTVAEFERTWIDAEISRVTGGH
jgi:hypothetical protein